MSKYQQARSTRRSYRNTVGKLRGGKLVPVMAEPVRPSEGGMLRQVINLELDPIPGRLITEISAEIHMVFVPVQAADAIKDPAADFSGLTDVIREKLLSGTPLFGLENENEISKRCAVVPRSIGGVKKVSELVRLAHNAAVNHLRMRKYVKASLLLHTNISVTPAILAQTVLDRLNGVLDPEDRVNGMVQFQTGTVTSTAAFPATTLDLKRAFIKNDDANVAVDALSGAADATTNAASLAVKRANSAGAANPMPGVDIPAQNLPVNLSGLNIGSVSLTDFYQAEEMDRLVREMRLIIDNNPQHGEEMVLNWAHGLQVDAGSVPWVLAERRVVFNKALRQAMDTAGITDDVRRTDGLVQADVSVLVPKTELGGCIITFVSLKPDETLASQPHPILSDVWTVDNFVADELKQDPVAVTFREINSEVAAGDEATVALYVGHNHLKANYVHYGFNRQLDPATVENKAAIWQLAIPMSVNPQSVLYPDYLDHGVFAYGGTQASPVEVCAYNVESYITFQSPMILGPTPVEELAAIETGNLFPDNPV